MDDGVFLHAATQFIGQNDWNDDDSEEKLAALLKQMYIEGQRSAFAKKDAAKPDPIGMFP